MLLASIHHARAASAAWQHMCVDAGSILFGFESMLTVAARTLVVAWCAKFTRAI